MDWLLNLDFTTRALMAGLGIAILAGPLGSLMIWRRMAYFGDTLAHSTLLGISLALLMHLNIYFGLVTISLIIAGILAALSKQKWLASDAILGILSHTTLAVGLVAATAIQGVRVDLLSYLYGDILAVNLEDLIYIGCVMIIVAAVLWRLWRWLLAATIHNDLAQVEGVPVNVANWAFIILLALVFAVAIKLVGVLLITALLIIPASAARRFARTPELMIGIASLFGCVAVVLGFWASMQWDWPTGPAIVVAAAGLFGFSLLMSKMHAA
ncbi:MAG TPA: metal ABC transporter permease [Gammaproteobacteria bacterium]|nr:metal ABC transporter permease [Gammaproteobacteria bacterium]